MRDWFSEADPANADYYAANYETLKDSPRRARQHDRARRSASVPAENRKLLTYHDSWAYWARRYGFTVIGAVQASDFSDPSPQDVARLIDQIRAEQVPAVFGSEVFPSPVLEQIARESGREFVDDAAGRRAARGRAIRRAHLLRHAQEGHADHDRGARRRPDDLRILRGRRHVRTLTRSPPQWLLPLDPPPAKRSSASSA